MSELINTHDTRATIRWKLLTGASALALSAYIASAGAALAEDNDHTTVWLELGTQLERNTGEPEPFSPPFLTENLHAPFYAVSPLSVQRAPLYSIAGDAKLSFEPQGSDWMLSAAIRYGRSSGSKNSHQQTVSYRSSGVTGDGANPYYVHLTRFGDTVSTHKQDHLTLDFMAGKDVGLGLWNGKGSSRFNFGVRFAQFTSSTSTTLRQLPDPFKSRVSYIGIFTSKHKYHLYTHHNSFYGHDNISRSFRGVGPSISWNASVPFAGNTQTGELAFDWGANAALLFGRQKVKGEHQASGRYWKNFGRVPNSSYAPPPTPVSRSRRVTVPNVGGFAGLSFAFASAKISLGYRADWFFNAIDGGIDTRKSENRGFHGPFASISIGLGD
jgi:hypothetical protein